MFCLTAAPSVAPFKRISLLEVFAVVSVTLAHGPTLHLFLASDYRSIHFLPKRSVAVSLELRFSLDTARSIPDVIRLSDDLSVVFVCLLSPAIFYKAGAI